MWFLSLAYYNSVGRNLRCDSFTRYLFFFLGGVQPDPSTVLTMAILGLAPSSTPTRPAHFDIERVIRPNILALHPYRCARDDYTSGILLDANENALGHSIPSSEDSTTLQLNGKNKNYPVEIEIDPILGLDLHRYPDPSHPKIKERVAELRSLPGPDHVFLGVGSDEVIDLLMRVCVAPGREKILITPPTYGMYAVCAQVNDVGIVKVNLELTAEGGEGGEKGRFSLRVDEVRLNHCFLGFTSFIEGVMQVKKTIDADPLIKLIFLCSPGNPTGTLISLASIRALLDYEPFKGIVVVDEAYIDFSEPGSSAASLVSEYANICVMQTLSKSFGLAAIRWRPTSRFPSYLFLILSMQTRYSDRSTTAYPDSLKCQGTVQHFHSHSPSCITRFISDIAEHYAQKHRNAQGIAG